MSDQASRSVKELVDRVLEAKTQEQIAQRARELAAVLGEVAGSASQRASEAWRESAPLREDASRTVGDAGRKAAAWSAQTLQHDVAPALKRLLSSRTALMGAAGAVAPTVAKLRGKERREARHWGSFFVGLLVGAAAGVVAALLSAPKAGRQIRDDLAVTAREAAGRAREAANQAREAAANAGDWMPIFQRSTPEAVATMTTPAVEEISSGPSRKTKIRSTPEAADTVE